MSKDSVMYVEAFVESSYGYRWRFFDRDDVNAIVIEQQQWDADTRTWKPEKTPTEVIFGFDEDCEDCEDEIEKERIERSADSRSGGA